MLTQFGSLSHIFNASNKEINAVHGMGDSKYCQLQAIFEMSRCALAEEIKHQDALSSPEKVSDYLRLKLSRQEREVFVVYSLMPRIECKHKKPYLKAPIPKLVSILAK